MTYRGHRWSLHGLVTSRLGPESQPTLGRMGYRAHANWRDMSEFVVHFTKPIPTAEVGPPPPPPEQKGRVSREELFARTRYAERSDRTGYHQWISILYDGKLNPGLKPLGAARRIPELRSHHQVVCFSEIPLDMLDRLIERRSLYGNRLRKGLHRQAGWRTAVVPRQGRRPGDHRSTTDRRESSRRYRPSRSAMETHAPHRQPRQLPGGPLPV